MIEQSNHRRLKDNVNPLISNNACTTIYYLNTYERCQNALMCDMAEFIFPFSPITLDVTI